MSVDAQPYAKVAFIGFGEAGPVFGRALLDAGVAQVTAYDILTDDRATAPAHPRSGDIP